MTDEAGGDTKLLAVPIDKLTPLYRHIETCATCPSSLSQITHFFQHYKDLEPGKWVKIEGWGSPRRPGRGARRGEGVQSARPRPHAASKPAARGDGWGCAPSHLPRIGLMLPDLAASPPSAPCARVRSPTP
jgi:hypothetical protein